MTACERLDHGVTWIKEKGWRQGGLRAHKNFHYDPDGAACLVGSLITPEEFNQYNRGELILGSFAEVKEAVRAMGFEDISDAWKWNDILAKSPDHVLDRLQQGKAKICRS